MKVQVDPELCQGHARCFTLAPELFELDDQGNAHVAENGEVATEFQSLVQRAVANCPEHAISIVS